MIPFLPVVVIGSRSLAYQGAADAASQACEGLPLRTLAFLPPLRWNDLVESPFQLARVAWRYTPRIRQCVGRSRLIACAQVLSRPFSPSPLPPLASPLLAAPVIREKSQFRAQHDSLSLSLRS